MNAKKGGRELASACGGRKEDVMPLWGKDVRFTGNKLYSGDTDLKGPIRCVRHSGGKTEETPLFRRYLKLQEKGPLRRVMRSRKRIKRRALGFQRNRWKGGQGESQSCRRIKTDIMERGETSGFWSSM